jgi:hypothetical protein
MGEVKPWQIAVIVVGLIVMVGGVAYSCRSSERVDFATSIIMVDVTTGELIASPLPANKTVQFPAVNPGTKFATFYPAEQKDGQWFVSSMYLPHVAKEPAPKAMNNRGQITTVTAEPVKKDLF